MSTTTTKLTPRENRVICLLAHGMSSVEIAKRMRIAPSSVDVYLAHAQHALGLHRRTQVVIYALKVGLVCLEDIELPGQQAKKSEVTQ